MVKKIAYWLDIPKKQFSGYSKVDFKDTNKIVWQKIGLSQPFG